MGFIDKKSRCKGWALFLLFLNNLCSFINNRNHYTCWNPKVFMRITYVLSYTYFRFNAIYIFQISLSVGLFDIIRHILNLPYIARTDRY